MWRDGGAKVEAWRGGGGGGGVGGKLDLMGGGYGGPGGNVGGASGAREGYCKRWSFCLGKDGGVGVVRVFGGRDEVDVRSTGLEVSLDWLLFNEGQKEGGGRGAGEDGGGAGREMWAGCARKRRRVIGEGELGGSGGEGGGGGCEVVGER